MNFSVIKAIFKRNFVSYFSNPTGYVFICVFVLLSAFATFWPHEFFNANLANLDQFNRYLPLIMLVFIPAITMSIWAEERRQGTDELLLTIPAGDLDVVVGKYLAAVAIYTVSLLFSLCNVMVLAQLGVPDWGLLFAGYLGYWLLGLAMIAIGMVASFLTSNLTVGFILGAAFNAPLVFASSADVILPDGLARAVKHWSFADQFRDFGRGVISLSSVSYFILITVVMLYLCMVLISRRHWRGSPGGQSLGGHFVVRVVALALIAIAVASIFNTHDRRVDATVGKLSSLSPQTITLIGDLQPERPVHIDAYVSPTVPESYVQSRLNLLALLREFDQRGGDEVTVTIHETERFSEAAARAEQLYGIEGRQVRARVRGAVSEEEIYLGVGITSGLDKVVVPFFDRGVPVEYELIRSVCTVSQQERKKIGIITTDAQMFGSFDMQRMTPSRNELIVDELQKQYEVVQVSPDSPIIESYDALVAVQPSSLTQEQLDNLLAVIRSGQPTAVFEDPFPFLDGSVPGTSAPKRPAGNPMMGMQQPPQPKGNIAELWNLLGVDFSATEIVWQDFNPYPKLRNMSFVTPEWVFIAEDQGGENSAFNEQNAISSKLRQMLFLYPGTVRRRNVSNLEFTPLVQTGLQTGTIMYGDILRPGLFGQQQLNPDLHLSRRRNPVQYNLAAKIQGRPDAAAIPMSDDGLDSTVEPAAGADPNDPVAGFLNQRPDGDMNVVLVTDIDLLYSAFFELRSRGEDPDAEVNLLLDNVAFVLNSIDVLAGDDRFLEIRKRRPSYPTLTKFEQQKQVAEARADEERQKFVAEFESARDVEQSKLNERIDKIRQRTDLDPAAKQREIEIAEAVGSRRLEATTEKLAKDRSSQIEQVEMRLEADVRQQQDRVKLLSVLLPPLIPMLLGVFVFLGRRSRERESVGTTRLR